MVMYYKVMSQRFLRRANNVLITLIILVAGYIIATPFVPQLLFFVHSHQGQAAELNKAITPKSSSSAATAPTQVAPQPNHIVIPDMLLNQPIYQGTDVYAELDKGIWLWPGGSTPDKGGNTVMLGHRFTYTVPKGVFYFLDKLKTGSQIGVFWNNKLYNYTVVGTKVVDPSDTSILAPTTTPTLTLYTCTPLWNPKDRLVVTAELGATP